MEAPSWVVLALAWLAAAALLSKLFSFRRPQEQNRPSGPKPWPIIGNLNLIGHLPHQSLHKLSQKYGQIMELRFGYFPVVVASSSEMAKQFLKTNDHLFASRPETAAGKYTTYNYSNITWAPYGPYWRQGRKIYLTELFSSKRLASYEYIRVEERQAFISRLYALSGKPVMLKEHLSRVTLSIISRIVLGEKYFSESRARYVKRMKVLRDKFDRSHDHVLEKHRARTEAGDFVAKDMVDMLLRLADDPDLQVKLTTDGVKGFTQDLIAGGTDTSATTVEWAMSEILRQPSIAKKATEELDRVIGR
ncbi:hypothetical protein AAG906_009638 [Vitis piasezkii]